MRTTDHRVVATWIFGGLTFAFLAMVFVFAPDELPRYKHRILSVFSSALAAFFAFFLSGTISISGTPQLPLVGKVAVRATGGLGVFALTLLWWSSDFAPVKIQRRIAIVAFVSAEDIHLGDNVYPDRWGFSHNPLNIDIYPQPARGLIYFDKDTSSFLAGADNQTIVGQLFVRYYRPLMKEIDFSGHRFVSAHYDGDPVPAVLKRYIESKEGYRLVRIGGPATLFTNEDNKGNFYHRYAAVAVVRPIDFTIPLAQAGFEFHEDRLSSVELFIECYHGGIRPGQAPNFALFLNGHTHEIRTQSFNMREKEVVTLQIPVAHLNFKQQNTVGVFVLPWQEEKPVSSTTGRGPVHFRDVGLVNAYFRITERG